MFTGPGHQDYGFNHGGSGIYFIELPSAARHAAEHALGSTNADHTNRSSGMRTPFGLSHTCAGGGGGRRGYWMRGRRATQEKIAPPQIASAFTYKPEDSGHVFVN